MRILRPGHLYLIALNKMEIGVSLSVQIKIKYQADIDINKLATPPMWQTHTHAPADMYRLVSAMNSAQALTPDSQPPLAT